VPAAPWGLGVVPRKFRGPDDAPCEPHRRYPRQSASRAFDQLTALKQVLADVDKRKPGDLLKLGRAVVGLLSAAGTEPDSRLLDTTPPVLDSDPADVTPDGDKAE
jgi:hypothetical protein